MLEKVFVKEFLRWLLVSSSVVLIIFLFKVIYDPVSIDGKGPQFAPDAAGFALLFALLCGIAEVVLCTLKASKSHRE